MPNTYIVKNLRNKMPDFIVYDIIIFTDNCMTAFLEKHVNRIYSKSKTITRNTCIIDESLPQFDEDGIRNGIPDEENIKNSLSAAVLSRDMPIKTVRGQVIILLVNHSLYPYLKAREYQKNDYKKELVEADNKIFDFKLLIAINEITFYNNFSGQSKELLDNHLNKDELLIVGQYFNDVYAFIKRNSEEKQKLINSINQIKNEIALFESLMGEDKRELKIIKTSVEQLKKFGSPYNDELKKQEQKENDIKFSQQEIINMNTELTKINIRLKIVDNAITQLNKNRVFVVEHIIPAEEK